MSDGGVVNLESGFHYETIRSLTEKGHKIEWTSGPYGGYQPIRWQDIESYDEA
jgi:gamma-glutamyltranspeptidase / glutathione hydrolase